VQRANAIIFDADGTIFNSFGLIVQAYSHISETYGVAMPEEDEIKAKMGKPLGEMLKYFFPNIDVAMLMDTNHSFVSSNVSKATLYPGMKPLLKEMYYRGVKLGVLTNGNKTIERIIAYYNLTKYFSSIVHADRINFHKPEPNGVYLVCKEAGVSTSETVVVGDSIDDIEAGKRASVLATILIDHGLLSSDDIQKSNPDYIVTSTNELRKIVRLLT